MSPMWRLPAALLAALLATALLARWLLPPVTGRAGLARSVEEPWRLVPPSQADPDALLSEIVAARLWPLPVLLGLPLPTAAVPEALTPPDWRIAGAYSAGGQAVAILSVTGKPDLFLRVGERLPGGARLEAIAADHLIITLNGKRLFLSTLKP